MDLLTKDQLKVLSALKDLGGEGTTEEICWGTGSTSFGGLGLEAVSKALRAMAGGLVECVGGRGRKRRWKVLPSFIQSSFDF